MSDDSLSEDGTTEPRKADIRRTKTRSGSKIRPIVRSDLERVCAYVAARMGSKAQRYRRILDTPWQPDQENYGMLLEEAGEVRAVLGAVYSTRRLDGVEYRFCNLTSWCADDSHRRVSVGLLRSLMSQAGYTFTNFSPSKAVAGILTQAGFSPLDEGKLIFPPIPRALPSGRVRVLHDPADVRAAIEPADRVIFDDHRGYRCGQLALIVDGAPCHIVTVRRGRDRLYFADVLYASRPDLLAAHVGSLFPALFRRHGTLLIGIDAREFPEPPRLTYKLPRPSLAFSKTFPARRIATIYSEIVGMYA